MPIRTIYRDDGGVVLKGFGTVTGTELLKVKHHLFFEHQKDNKIEYQLCDFSKVEKVVFSTEEIQSLAEQEKLAAETNCSQLIAVVASQDVIFGMSRMRQAFADSEYIINEFFKTREDAEAWLIQQRSELVSYRTLL